MSPALTWGICGVLGTAGALWPPPQSRVVDDWLLNFDPAPIGNIETASLLAGLPAHIGQQKASEYHLENTLKKRKIHKIWPLLALWAFRKTQKHTFTLNSLFLID